MESEIKRGVVSTTVDKFQWCRCAIGLHKRNIIDFFKKRILTLINYFYGKSFKF